MKNDRRGLVQDFNVSAAWFKHVSFYVNSAILRPVNLLGDRNSLFSLKWMVKDSVKDHTIGVLTLFDENKIAFTPASS